MTIYIESWINRCINETNYRLISAQDIRGGRGGQVWDCQIEIAKQSMQAILKIYGAEFEDYSRLGIRNTLRKNVYAFQEFPHYSVPTASILGHAEYQDEAAILLEKVYRQTWQHQTRIEAARLLANLHGISFDVLDSDFIALIRQSTPNRHRVFLSLEMADELDQHAPEWRSDYANISAQIDFLRNTDEPIPDLETLVHGDFFSVNILFGENGLSIIDWDLLSIGDPMWDLGFLIGADRDIADQEVDATISAYCKTCPIDSNVLKWHKHCWDAKRQHSGWIAVEQNGPTGSKTPLECAKARRNFIRSRLGV